MAEASDGITCPLCLDTFEDPKILPCGHIYCKDPCLTGLAKRSNYTAITCPECRQITQLQAGNVDAFPTVYKIVSLVDSYKAKGESVDQPDSASRTCQIHQGQEIALYCETCSKTLCRDCVLRSTEHKQHETVYIDDVIAGAYDQLLIDSTNSQSVIQTLSRAKEAIEATCVRISSRQEELKSGIDAEITKVARILSDRKMALHSRLDQIANEKLKRLQLQHQEITQAHSDLQTTSRTTKSAAQNLPDADFLLEMKRMQTRLKKTIELVQEMDLEPVVDASIGLCVSTMVDTAEHVHLYSGKLATPSKCRFQRHDLENHELDSGLEYMEIGEQIVIRIIVLDSDGKSCPCEQSVSVELHCLRDLSITYLDPHSGPSDYYVHFTPTTRGRHMLAIKVNGQHILGSPTPVFVHMPPQKLSAPVTTIYGLQQPAGMHCCNGGILACDIDGNRLVKIDTRYHLISEVVRIENGPHELTTDSSSNIFLTTFKDNRLHKIDKRGHIMTTGSSGSGKDQFDFANGMDIFEDKLYVCDSLNHRIKVYDLQLNLVEIIGKKGTRLGQFLGPGDIAFDTNRMMYVAEQMSHRIQVFSPQRKALREIPIVSPITVKLFGDHLYVTQNSRNCISVITTSGAILAKFGTHYVMNPEGLEIDQDGYVYVTSKGKIFVF